MIVGLLLNSYSLSTVGVDNRNFQSNLKKIEDDMFPVNCQSWQLELSELPKTWKTLCLSSTARVDNCSFQSYQNPVNCQSSFHGYQKKINK